MPSIDPTDGLDSERSFENQKHGYSLAVLGMDLDGFKAVNDTYGHEAGDRVLVEVARILRGCLRESDLVARPGGDEFIGALLETSLEDALRLAKNIQWAVDSLSFELSPGKLVSIGISIGCATYPEHGDTLEELLRVADAEMYRDKKSRAGMIPAAPPS